MTIKSKQLVYHITLSWRAEVRCTMLSISFTLANHWARGGLDSCFHMAGIHALAA